MIIYCASSGNLLVLIANKNKITTTDILKQAQKAFLPKSGINQTALLKKRQKRKEKYKLKSMCPSRGA